MDQFHSPSVGQVPNTITLNLSLDLGCEIDPFGFIDLSLMRFIFLGGHKGWDVC